MFEGSSTALESQRDRHLFGPGPKRLLALDGGGSVRSALTLAFLERIENLLQNHHGKDVRLGDYFDLIGGTSTGAIIAIALALGNSVAEIKEIYFRLAATAFKRSGWRIPGLKSKFNALALADEVSALVADRRLDSPDLITGLAIIAKRMDTGSPWIMANNKKAPYFEGGHGKSRGHIGNKHYKLSTLVRACASGFVTDILPITDNAPQDTLGSVKASSLLLSRVRALHGILSKSGPRHDTHGLFVDGGLTPHNNPALALFRLVTLPPFNINWPTGPDRLTVISLGTGRHLQRLSFESLATASRTKHAFHLLTSMMADAEMLVMEMMQWMGECPQPWQINSEIGTLADVTPPGGKLFRFLRYDVWLEKNWLASELNYQASDEKLQHLRNRDDSSVVNALYEIGRAAAEKQVKDADFTHAFEPQYDARRHQDDTSPPNRAESVEPQFALINSLKIGDGDCDRLINLYHGDVTNPERQES